MKKFEIMYKFSVFFAASFFGVCFTSQAQVSYQQVSIDFDVLKAEVAHGSIDAIVYNSTTVGVQRSALVYTPPGFNKSKNYPVLYLLHGIGGDEKEWFNQGNPHIILDNLFAEKKIEPMIVVLPIDFQTCSSICL